MEHGFNDLWASLIPGAAGGASQEPVPHGTRLEDLLRQNGAQQKGGKFLGPLYWGKLPFTSGPIYFGAALILLFVFVFPFFSRSQQWLYGGAAAMLILLSLGNNASWFNRFLFEYFPLFNNFRALTSAMGVMPMFLAFGTMTGLERWRNEFRAAKKITIPKPYWIRVGVVAGICLMVALLGPSLFSFEGVNAQQYAQQNVLDILQEARAKLLRRMHYDLFSWWDLLGWPYWFFIREK